MVDKKFDNKYIPQYVPDNLKWYERDGLETWYRKNKCDDFLRDTDDHFKRTMITNFDMIRQKEKITKDQLKQYHTIDYKEIEKYPQDQQLKITSSIFRHISSKEINVSQELIKDHFEKQKLLMLIELLDVENFLKFVKIQCTLNIGKKKIYILDKSQS